MIFQPLILGRLLHCEKTAVPGLFENRVEFQGISETAREVIIKYIFEEERKSKKID